MKGGARVMRMIAASYREREENAAGIAMDAEIERRKKCRLRLYECAECGKKLRVADDDLAAEHVHVDADTLAEFRYPFVLKTVRLKPLPF